MAIIAIIGTARTSGAAANEGPPLVLHAMRSGGTVKTTAHQFDAAVEVRALRLNVVAKAIKDLGAVWNTSRVAIVAHGFKGHLVTGAAVVGHVASEPKRFCDGFNWKVCAATQTKRAGTAVSVREIACCAAGESGGPGWKELWFLACSVAPTSDWQEPADFGDDFSICAFASTVGAGNFSGGELPKATRRSSETKAPPSCTKSMDQVKVSELHAKGTKTCGAAVMAALQRLLRAKKIETTTNDIAPADAAWSYDVSLRLRFHGEEPPVEGTRKQERVLATLTHAKNIKRAVVKIHANGSHPHIPYKCTTSMLFAAKF